MPKPTEHPKKRLQEMRKELENALFVLRCSSDPPLSAVKTIAETQIEIVDLLLKP